MIVLILPTLILTILDLVAIPNKAVDFFSICLIHRCSQPYCTWHVFNLCPAFFIWLTPLTHLGPWVLENISLSNCAQSILRISEGYMFLVVWNLTVMQCTTAEKHTLSLIMIIINEKQVDMQW